MSHLKNIAIVGGSGQSGTPIVKALLEARKFNVTAITRNESSSTFPSDVKVQRGDYASNEFFESSLQGQDVLIILLAGTAPEDLQSRLIDAAATAAVPFVLPCEFGPDTGHPEMTAAVPVLATKKAYRDQIERLGKSSWIGFVTGLWFDFSLKAGFFGPDVQARTVRLFDDGNTKLSTTTLSRVGVAVAKLLALPLAQLEAYKNDFVYVQSFCVSQNDMLRSLCRVTRSGEDDWSITREPVEEVIAKGRKEFEGGNFKGLVGLLYGMNFKPGAGGDFAHKVANRVLGLEEEDLDEVVRRIVEGYDLPSSVVDYMN